MCLDGKATLIKGDNEYLINNAYEKSYLDGNVEWDKEYTYTLIVDYNGNKKSFEKSVYTGNSICENKFDNEPFCVKGDITINDIVKSNVGGYCNDGNNFTVKKSCSEGFCKIEENNGVKDVVCALGEDCESKNNAYYNGTLTKEYCETIQEGKNKGDKAYCFYDNKSYAVQSACYSCNEVDSCFSYKSEGSCNSDSCGIGNCEWKPILDNVNGGICVSKSENNCELLSDPEKNSGATSSAYSEVLQPILYSGNFSFNNLYSNANYQCTNIENDCYKVESCLDYSEEECSKNVCLDIKCGFNSNLNKCVRLDDKDNSVCNGEENCEKDWFAPESNVKFYSEKSLFEITVLKDKKNRFGNYENSNLNDLDFFVCIPLQGKNDCSDINKGYKKIDSKIFGFKSILSEEDFNLIRGKDSELYYYAKDKYDNFEKVKKILFKSLFYSEAKKEILLLNPKYGGIIKGEDFYISVKTNFNSESCYYKILNVDTDEKSLDINGVLTKSNNVYYSNNLNKNEDFYLYLRCTSSDDNKDYYAKYFIDVKDVTESITILDAYAQPKVLFKQNPNGNYETKVYVKTNDDAFCKYSLEEKDSYDFNNMDYFYGTENFGYEDFSKEKSYTLIIPNNYIDKEFNITLKCINRINTLSDVKKIKSMKITSDPSFEDWIEINVPKKSYYNENNITFNLTTYIDSECSLKLKEKETTLISGDMNNTGLYHTYTANIEDGNYDVIFICKYEYKENDEIKNHVNSKKVNLVIDTKSPVVNFSIIGDSYESGRPIIYNNYLKIKNNISDDTSGVKIVNYNVLDENGRIVSKGILDYKEENTIIKNLDLESGKVYTLKLTVYDNANNKAEKSEDFKADFSIYCNNNVFDPYYETDLDCGKSCDSCGVGKSCNTNDDCSEGLLCDEVYNKCYASTCYDNIKNGNEEGVDCGGSCAACEKELKLIYPKFGISSEEKFNVLINSSKDLVCKYSFDKKEYKTIDEKADKEHYIYDVYIKNNDKKTLYLTCTDGKEFYNESFVLKVDVEKPEIKSFNVNPKVVPFKINKNGVEGYWTEFNVITDKRTVCRFSESEKNFEKMKGIFDRGNENKSFDYVKVHNVWIPLKEEKNYTFYVQCKGLNSLNTNTYTRKIVVDKNADANLLILYPYYGKIYSSKVLALIDSTVKSNYCKYSFDSFELESLDKKVLNSNIYSSEFKTITSGTHVLTAVCNYDRYDNKDEVIGSYNVSVKRNFLVDVDKPIIKSVVLKDPYTDNNVLESEALKVVVDYEEENVYFIKANVYVDGNEVLEKKFFGDKKEFIINGLNFTGKNVKVKITIFDVNGNYAEKESEYVSVSLKEKNYSVLGGECNSNAECSIGVCNNNVCVTEKELCENNVFDKGYETDVDCGGVCLQYNKTCDVGKSCISTLDCNTNEQCISNICVLDVNVMCNNDKKDVYETDKDCGDLCEFYLDKSCEVGEKCNSNADCSSGKCEGNVCVENDVKTIPEYCKKDVFNNTYSLDDNTTVFCGDECDYKCIEGVSCRNSFDCENGLDCINNTCTKTEVKKEKCIPVDEEKNCGGSCEPCGIAGICNTDEDCAYGLECSQEDKVCVKKTEKVKDICFDDSDCASGFVCDSETASCVEKKVSFLKYFLIFLIFLFFGSIGYVSYLYYYKPEEFEKLKNTFNFKNKSVEKNNKIFVDKDKSSKINSLNKGKTLSSTTTQQSFNVNPPKNKPIVESEKQKKIQELIRKKRLEEKKKEREELLKKLEESKLDKKEK